MNRVTYNSLKHVLLKSPNPQGRMYPEVTYEMYIRALETSGYDYSNSPGEVERVTIIYMINRYLEAPGYSAPRAGFPQQYMKEHFLDCPGEVDY